jgi:hypothetical protein
VGAALQIEPKNDVTLCPVRPALNGLFREEIGDGEQANDECREQDRHCLPFGDIEHCF